MKTPAVCPVLLRLSVIDGSAAAKFGDGFDAAICVSALYSRCMQIIYDATDGRK